MKRLFMIVLGLVAAACALAILLPVPMHKKQTAILLRDVSNLRMIGACCQMYAVEHEGNYPDDWSLLGSYVANATSLFTTVANRHLAGSLTNVMQWTDYIYVRGHSTRSSPRAVLAYLPAGQYPKNDKTAVVFVDGFADILNRRDFTRIMNEPQQSLPPVSVTRGTPAAYAPVAPGIPER